jgi:hypothetical protein
MAKEVFVKKILFPSKLDVNWRMKLVKFYIWSVDFHGTESWALRKTEQK